MLEPATEGGQGAPVAEGAQGQLQALFPGAVPALGQGMVLPEPRQPPCPAAGRGNRPFLPCPHPQRGFSPFLKAVALLRYHLQRAACHQKPDR